MLLEPLAGVLAGAIHAISGPDHLAAVAPIVVRRPESAGRLGMRWGLGHALGATGLGGLGWLARDALPIDWASGIAERGVGVLLIAIGLWALRRGVRTRLHTHPHDHDDGAHTHVHLHGPAYAHAPHESSEHATSHADSARGPGSERDLGRGSRLAPHAPRAHGHAHGHAALGVGALHGLAGTSHLVGVLPALALSSSVQVGVYLVGYAVGATAAMAAFGWLVGVVTRSSGGDGTQLYRGLVSAAGGASVITGAVWVMT